MIRRRRGVHILGVTSALDSATDEYAETRQTSVTFPLMNESELGNLSLSPLLELVSC